jgi:hypothetical protein
MSEKACVYYSKIKHPARGCGDIIFYSLDRKAGAALSSCVSAFVVTHIPNKGDNKWTSEETTGPEQRAGRA